MYSLVFGAMKKTDVSSLFLNGQLPIKGMFTSPCNLMVLVQIKLNENIQRFSHKRKAFSGQFSVHPAAGCSEIEFATNTEGVKRVR